jgi:CheY-like chemotaxis protein
MKKTILLVEDNEVTQEVMQLALETLGYGVLVARNGGEAVGIAASYRPDVIVMDIHMPKMDGLAAALQIRHDPKSRTIPILAATAKAMPGDKERCLANGCSSYLAKPFTHHELDRAIKNLLK